MRALNWIIVFLLLAALVVLGGFIFLAAIDPFLSSLGVQSTDVSDLPAALRPDGIAGGTRNYLTNIENGNVGAEDAIVLGLIALLGLLLFVLELRPRTPRKVRMGGGTYVTRNVVRDEAASAVGDDPEVLQSNVNVKAQRSSGARIDVRADVRAGDDAQSIQTRLQEEIRNHLDGRDVPVGNLRVRAVGADPRQTRKRVN